LELNAAFTLKLEPAGMARVKNLSTREEMVVPETDVLHLLKTDQPRINTDGQG
jgi:hypothetical protein